MHARRFAAIALITLGLGGSGCAAEEAADNDAQTEELVGDAEQAISGGWNDAATPEANATVRVAGVCTGTLVRPDVVLTAAHCLGNLRIGPCTGPEAAQSHQPGRWYQFTCREPVEVLFGNDRVGLWANGLSLGAEETFKLRDLGAGNFASNDALSLQSSGGYLLAGDRGGGAWVTVDQPGSGAAAQFVMERESGPGQIQNGQTVYLRLESRYVTVSRDGLLELKATSRTSAGRFMVSRTAGPGALRDRDLLGLLASNGRWVRAAHGGGVWATREAATAYNLPLGSDIALLRLRNPVPGTIAKPMDLVHRMPANHLDLSRKWSDSFCLGSEECGTGDFNGDGRDDVMALTHGTAGNVVIGISAKDQPFIGALWNTGICTGSQECQTGDFNGDGMDDLVVFLKNTASGAAQNDVQVRLSTGAGFGPATRWSDDLCGIGRPCAAGDFNGDGKDDLVSFTKTAGAGASVGDVRVALSGRGAFDAPRTWKSSLCAGGEICKVGDFNGDGKDDIAVFLRDTSSTTARGDVLVSLSNGIGFGAAELWHSWFCFGGELCDVGDFNGDGKDDIMTFVRDARTDRGRGAVYVAVSNGDSFGASRVWNDSLCRGSEVCKTGDFNGDGYADAVAFTRNSSPGIDAGDVRVSLAVPPGAPQEFFNDKQLMIAGWGDADNVQDVTTRPLLRQAGRVGFDRIGGEYDGINTVRVRPLSSATPEIGDAGGPLVWWDADKRRFLTLGANQAVDEASRLDYAITFGPGGCDSKQHNGSCRSDLGWWVRAALAIKN